MEWRTYENPTEIEKHRGVPALGVSGWASLPHQDTDALGMLEPRIRSTRPREELIDYQPLV